MDKDLRQFLNRLKCLWHIDRSDLAKAFGVEDVSDKEWVRFRDSPASRFFTMDDERQDAVWKILTAQYPGEDAERAPAE